MRTSPSATAPYRGFTYVQSSGVSDEAIRILSTYRTMFQTLATVASIQPRFNAIGELNQLYTECATENWDSEGAAPITEAAYREAAKFLLLLPSTIPTPDVVPEPNGSVGFEWQRGHRVFVVSVNGRQTLSFAGVFGPGVRVHGSENFTDSIPTAVITNIQRLREG